MHFFTFIHEYFLHPFNTTLCRNKDYRLQANLHFLRKLIGSPSILNSNIVLSLVAIQKLNLSILPSFYYSRWVLIGRLLVINLM